MKVFCLLVLLLCVSAVNSGVVSTGNGWTSVTVFDELPLEAKLGVLEDIPDPHLAGIVLWNDGANNRLDALMMPPPYDGTGLMTTALDNSATLFSLGDLCTEGNVVVAPYIDNFNVEYARFNGSSWSTLSIPFTQTDNFDSADCATSEQGIFVSAHNDTNDSLLIFLSINGGLNWSIYETITGGPGRTISGPFDGAVRDQLAMNHHGDAASLYQLDNGMVRVSTFSTTNNPPSRTDTDIVNLPPPAGFTFVRESGGIVIDTASGMQVRFTYNADGDARTANIPIDNPGLFTTGNLGTIDNNGMFFNFQSGALVGIVDENDNSLKTNVLWGDYFIVEDPFVGGLVSIDPEYPAQGFGGPVDGCVVHRTNSKSFDTRYITAGPNNDTVINTRIGENFFADGFESGDTSSWTCSSP